MELYKFIKQSWTDKYIFFWITLAYGLLFTAPIIALDWGSKKFWTVCGCLFVCYILLIYIVHTKRKYPKFSKDSYGILFAIDVENEEQYRLINKKFVTPFENHCTKQLTSVEVRMLNSFTIQNFSKLKYNKEQLIKLAEKNHYKFIVFGNSYFGNEQEVLDCKIEIESFWNFHNSMSHNNHLMLSNEMSILRCQIKDIEINKATETHEFALYAEQLELIFKYILAMTFLLCEDIPTANRLFLILNTDLNNFKKNIAVINNIKSIINSRITQSYLLMARNSLHEYYESKNKFALLTMKNHLDDAMCYDENSYDGKILLGFFHFLYNRDIKCALEVLNKCKNEKNNTWKQNIAFLKLYAEDSIPNFLNAYKIYRQLDLHNDLTMTNITEVSEFIHMVLDEEPDKKQLYFILFLIYYYLGDEELENKYYDCFLENYPNLLNNDRLNDILYKMGKVKQRIVA